MIVAIVTRLQVSCTIMVIVVLVATAVVVGLTDVVPMVVIITVLVIIMRVRMAVGMVVLAGDVGAGEANVVAVGRVVVILVDGE